MKRGGEWRIFLAVAVVACGVTVAAHPYLTDLRYWLAQWEMSLAASGSAVAATGGQAMPEGAVARVMIPEIGLDAYVRQGTSADVLNDGPGHYEETPMPGERGNCAIAGHRTMYGHPFRRLDELKPGDQIVTATEARGATYRVVSVRPVSPRDVGVAAPTTDDRLTLTTCNPVGSARQRLVVTASLVR